MAQRAIININGDLIPFSEDLDRIRTPGLGGSAVTWVPDANTICDQLKITANGTYSAAEAGKYGYDYVVVSVPGSSVTGRDPDTGEEVEVHPDPETGEIVTTVLPTEIRVITPPAKTDYADGETIDYSGIMVHAYSATGQDMGAVPFNALAFPVTTAVYSGDSDGSASSDYSGNIDQPIAFKTGDITVERFYEEYEYFNIEYKIASGNIRAIGYTTGTELILYFVSDAPFSGDVYLHDKYLPTPSRPYPDDDYRKIAQFVGAMRTIHDKPVYISSNRVVQLDTIANAGVPTYGQQPNDNDLYTMVYGDITTGSIMHLPVQWPRTPDGAVLETTFSINVTGGST